MINYEKPHENYGMSQGTQTRERHNEGCQERQLGKLANVQLHK